MRRLVLQLPLEDIARIYGEQIVPENIEAVDVLHVLRQDENEFASICRVILKRSSKSVVLPRDELDHIQLLESKDDRTYTYFVRTKPRRGSLDSQLLKGIGGYFTQPIEVRDGKWTLTFIGDANQVKRLIRRVERTKIPYKVISLMDAKFSLNSPLATLTEQQRRVLVTAYNLGYYDLPRRVNSEELAEKLHMRSSTFSLHRIKAERRLIAEAIGSPRVSSTAKPRRGK
jgi:predicted DNA binding protein